MNKVRVERGTEELDVGAGFVDEVDEGGRKGGWKGWKGGLCGWRF